VEYALQIIILTCTDLTERRSFAFAFAYIIGNTTQDIICIFPTGCTDER